MTGASHLQTQFVGRIPHAVQQRMARRAQNPHHTRPLAIGDAPPSAVSLFSRLVSNVEDAMFAATFTARRRVRVVATKPCQVTIRQAFRFGTSAINLVPIRVAKMPLTDALRDASASASVGACALLVSPRQCEKLRPANQTRTGLVRVLGRSRPSKCGAATLRTKAAIASPELVVLPAMVAVSDFHSARLQ